MKSNKFLLLTLASSLLSLPPALAQDQNAETLKCLSAPIGAANFNWSFQISQDLSNKIDARLQFDNLKKNIAVHSHVRDTVKGAFQKSMTQAIQNFDPTIFLRPGFNAQAEVMKMVNQFSEQLNADIKNGVKIDQEMNFQIMIAPKLSDELAARRAGGGIKGREIPLMLQYPNDRLVVFNNMAEADAALKSANDKISTDVYAGIAEYFNKAYECKVKKPFLTSALVNVKISPNEQDSTLSAQVILGMPSGIELPFTEANDQVQFEKIAFPVVNPKTLAINNGGIADASQYPVAIVLMQQKIASPNTEIPVLIEFGPLGNFQNGKWSRANNDDFTSLVPKLKGHAVGNFIKSKIAIDFNIYNLRLDVAKQELTELDIYLSVGYSRIPNLKVGRINKPEVDEQFQAEINKTIQAQISVQKERINRIAAGALTPDEKAAILGGVAKVGDQKGVSPEFTKVLLESLFGALENRK